MNKFYKLLIICLLVIGGGNTLKAASDLTVTIDTGASVTLQDADSDGFYDIGTADELYAFAAAVNGGNGTINGELTQDIVVNENVLDENGELNGDGSNFRVWIPIGNKSIYYAGTFNGNEYTISGLYYNNNETPIVGLFGSVDDSGKVTNVGVIDNYINGGEYNIGGVVGYNCGTITNCYNTGAVTGTDSSVGGVAGYNDGTITNCYNTGTVTGTDINVGGVAGYNNCTITNCYNTGTVTGTRCVGGVAGQNRDVTATITNCYNTGTVMGTDGSVGGIAGQNLATITNCYYLTGSAGAEIGFDGTINGAIISEVTEAQVKAASGEDGALIDLLNAWVAQQNDEIYKGWHLCSNGSSHYPSLNIKNSYFDNGENHVAKCSFCGFETTEAHTYFYTANNGAISENCELCGHSASINLVLPEAPVYNENRHEASYAGDYTNPNVNILIQYLQSNEGSETGYDVLESAPVDAGTYIVRLSVGEVYVDRNMAIAPKEISIIGVEVEYKDYDGTPYVEIDPYYGYGGFKAEGVLDYDNIEILCTSAELESANAGTYTIVTVKGLTITGEDAHNYTIVSEATVPVYNIWGNSESSVTVYERYVTINLFDQEAGSLDAIDQSKWEIDEYYGLLEGHRIESIKLVAEMNDGSTKYGSISVEEGSVKIVDANGNDVTANYSVSAYSATLTITCPDHDEFEHGFCKNCGGYEKASYNENENYYEIANAGQLFWFAEYVANISNEANAKLTDNIIIPEGKEWTPIYNLYGTFDGNYKTISGLNVSESDSDYVGFLGYVGYYANVRNLHITGSSFIDADATYVGAIVGYHGGGEITNCYTDKTVKIETGGVCGALVGYTSYSTMKNCYAHDVLAGNGYYGTFENCYYIGEDDEIDGTTAVATEQLASGEVAYLLQSGIAGEPLWDEENEDYYYDEDGNYIYGEAPHIWGQDIGTDAYPVFGGKKVYKLAEGIYSNSNDPLQKCGDNLYWKIKDDVLTIFGTGAMYDYDDSNATPWSEYNDNIEVIIVEGGVTYIGNNAFNATLASEIFFYGIEAPTLGSNSLPETADIYIPKLESWSEISWNNVNYMPTYTSQQVDETTSQQVWVGLAEGQTEPGENEHVAINAPLLLSQQANGQQPTANSLRFKSFGYCGDGTTTNGSITIEEGGQLYCETARGEVTVRKEIEGYDSHQVAESPSQQEGETKWYTISSPLKDMTSTSSVSGLLTTESDFDLYRYDEPSHTWQNAKPGEGSTNFQTIESGRGYLYANAENTTLEFTGDINTEDVNYTLTAQSEVLNGFHLVGNPYTHDISFNHLSADAELANGYYVLNGEGAWGATLGNEGDVIKVGQGALIKTTADGMLRISKSTSQQDNETTSRSQQLTANSQQLLLTVSNANHSDKAFVVFDKGVGLDKINHENENIPLLYIPQDGTDYAIAMIDENVKEIPVSFEAKTMGQYTISLQHENCDFEELYLLDKETGNKVNILEEDYTFMATTADNAERFILLKANSQQPTANSSHFAYVSGEDLIISVEGAVQIIDVMGRIIYSNDVTSDNSRIDVSGFDNAAYVVRVVNENGVKVQKIIL